MSQQVDWELLADHLGGALEGTPERERVAHLVETEPEWASAAAKLADALGAVTADLASLSGPVTMPDEVDARLTAALTGAAPPEDLPPLDEHAVNDHAVNGSLMGRPAPAPRRPAGAAPPAARPAGRRRARWIGAGVALAGVAAFGVVAVTPPGALTSGSDSAATDRYGGEAETGTAAGDGELLVFASGTNYHADLLATAPEPIAAPPPTDDLAEESGAAPFGAPQPTIGSSASSPPPAGLEPLWADPRPCLDAMSVTAVEQLDFAYFEGEPAIVIWAFGADGHRWVYVAGPDCGATPDQPDTVFEHRIN